MDFLKYQEHAMRTAKNGSEQFNLMHAALGLAGEAGEFVDCIKKNLVYEQPLNRENAIEELGDLLWFVALSCETLNVNMGDVAAQNIEKLSVRYPEKYSDFLAEKRADKG